MRPGRCEVRDVRDLRHVPDPRATAFSSPGVPSCGRTLAGSAVTPGRRDRGAPLAEQQPDEHAVPDEPAPRRRRTGLLLTLAVLVLALDVVSKLLVVRSLRPGQDVRELGGLVYLTQLRNVGAAFSFAEGATVLFTVIAVVVAAVIVRTARRLRSAAWATALGLVLGGAIGNLVDRLFRAPGFGRGGVVDWISVFAPDGRVWPVFNLADSAIVCGGILGALLAVLGVEFDGSRARRRPAERR
jgi:signal peptidase II